jgi:hypothetical protein
MANQAPRCLDGIAAPAGLLRRVRRRFGSPTIFVNGDDMYFGNDRLPLVRRWRERAAPDRPFRRPQPAVGQADSGLADPASRATGDCLREEWRAAMH